MFQKSKCQTVGSLPLPHRPFPLKGTNGPTNRRTDRKKKPFIEMRGRDEKSWSSILNRELEISIKSSFT